MPLSGTVYHSQARTYYINIPTKFEVSNSTKYEDMKGDTVQNVEMGWV